MIIIYYDMIIYYNMATFDNDIINYLDMIQEKQEAVLIEN